MSDKLPYEEYIKKQLEDLPVPSEEHAWEEMKKLLEEDDDDDRIVPFFFFKGCLIWGGLLLITAIGIWWYLNRGNVESKIAGNEKRTERIKDTAKQQPVDGNITTKLPGNEHSVQPMDSINENSQPKNRKPGRKNIGSKNQNYASTPKPVSSDKTLMNKKGKRDFRTSNNFRTSTTKKYPGAINKNAAPVNKTNTVINDKQITAVANNNPVDTILNIHAEKEIADPVKSNIEEDQKDSIAVDSATSIKDSSAALIKQKQRKFHYSAGIALQQQIPFSGQKANPYNHYGRRGSLADYIPSVYFRMHREDKWFIQAEFRYGAPQYVKEFVYNVEIVDSLGAATIQTEYKLKKTFYHQLNLSFNYKIRKNLFAGLGTQYARFYGAVSDAELHRKNLSTQEDVLLSSKTIQVPARTDSFFTRSHFNLLAETQYSYKKFSLGLRYVKGLQPYIKYVSNGTLQRDKNFSLQVFLRYRLLPRKNK